MQEATTRSEGQNVRPTQREAGPAPALASQSAAQSTPIPPVLLTDEQACGLMGISKRKFHELRSQPWMPKPIVLGQRLVRWSRLELERAVDAMPRQEQPSEPAQLRRARIDSMKRGGSQ